METLTPPFDAIYVVKVGSKTPRLYGHRGRARAMVTQQLDDEQNFRAAVELWSVNDYGWELMYKASEGDSFTAIPWETNVQREIARKEREKEKKKERELAREKELYEQLKQKFEQ